MTAPAADEAAVLFDVVSVRTADGIETTYKPSTEMAHVLETAGEFWQATARQAIKAMAQTRTSFCVDDLRADGLVPDPVNQNAWGAAFSAAANAGEIRHLGYRKSKRRSAHSRVVSVWTAR